jgi:Zn-dependent metalloprotease
MWDRRAIDDHLCVTRDRHRCCCHIAPPDLLAEVVREGSPEEREAALRTIVASASMRARRQITSSFMREVGSGFQGLGPLAPPSSENLSVYDVENQGASALPGKKVRGEGDPPVADAAVNEAYDGAADTFTFYRDVYDRDSIDDKGMEIISSVHYGVDFDNAFWNGTQMVYGDGSGRIFVKGSLTKAIDVIGHELTHGVTGATAGLRYSLQPGALNESMSDVFGSLVKQYVNKQTAAAADWLIGEGTLVASLGKALRSMKDPGTAYKGDRQPGHMRDYVDLPDDNDPSNDNGGVHINSGIPNHAFALAAIAIGGNAWEKAGRIWYATLTQRLRSDSDFAAAAAATVAVAGELFGDKAEQQAVHDAWVQVGVLS